MMTWMLFILIGVVIVCTAIVANRLRELIETVRSDEQRAREAAELAQKEAELVEKEKRRQASKAWWQWRVGLPLGMVVNFPIFFLMAIGAANWPAQLLGASVAIVIAWMAFRYCTDRMWTLGDKGEPPSRGWHERDRLGR